MTTNQACKLQHLQDAYASLCGLTLILIDPAGRNMTEPSGPIQLPRMLWEAPLIMKNKALDDTMERVQTVQRPIVYESEDGIKIIVAPVLVQERAVCFLLAGAWLDARNKELVKRIVTESAAAANKELWEQAVEEAPSLSAPEVEGALEKLVVMTDMISDMFETRDRVKAHANRLQLLRVLSLLNGRDDAWLRSILDIFVKITELQFAGFAVKSGGEQYVVAETSGTGTDHKRLQGAHFYMGEGLLGQVALTQIMGYWEDIAEDPRASIFTWRGLAPRFIICYPVKYNGRLYGLLFGGSAAGGSGMSEELADMGGILAGQMASEIHYSHMQKEMDKKRYQERALLELSQGLIDVHEHKTAYKWIVETIFRDTDAKFVAFQQQNTIVYALDGDEGQLTKAFAEMIAERGTMSAFRKTMTSRWRGTELLELPLVVRGEPFGALAAAFEQGHDVKEVLYFFHMAGSLLVHMMGSGPKEAGAKECIGTNSYAESPGLANKLPADGLPAQAEAGSSRRFYGKLTSREAEVLDLAVQGLNNTEIAKVLFISAHTVKNHMTKIYEKLEVADRPQALAKYFQALGNYS